ncbi:Gfo/Idh/MocA family oxidoreductase [Maribellus sp. YY47]|uniref:Gfo/Idh/MocA family protein n=1 Tax=Maribellus sp. YY47 TaxID=2929486 RepID=UPI002001B72B|nr:Gfo/Idh/MocA family oxidoreductase [Maribellus sp. YY47]MCK3683614.1 Gfo/Idh/MocA family oxidoreductase [Maribellus sp. YY47]
MSSNRRDFLRKATVGVAGVAVGGSVMGMSAKSYARILGANDRLQVVFMGCGRRVGAYYNMIQDKNNNVDLAYICDVMKSQREKVGKHLAGKVSGDATLINDIRAALEDLKVDAVFNATPDHWHAPGAWMAMEAGKHVYLEKPGTQNPREGEILIALQKKYNKFIQMGNQQRSSKDTITIINDIHKGRIGNVYRAVAFYSNNRAEVPVPKPAPVPEGLDWELWQGPAPREDYRFNTWDYNWHWYGWKWGTAESGNNGTHELDVARWALDVDYPEFVDVQGAKRHYANDGWEMYDTMYATFRFPEDKVIAWDCKSRNGYQTYGPERGTIIYGTEGTVYINRDGYKVYDRGGKLLSDNKSNGNEAGTALGGGGSMSDAHIRNFFDAIRGKTSVLNSPIEMGAKSQMLTHYANIAFRVGKSFEVDKDNGRIYDRDAMKLWGREYEKGWEPKV